MCYTCAHTNDCARENSGSRDISYYGSVCLRARAADGCLAYLFLEMQVMRDFHQRRLHVRIDFAQAAGGLHGQRQIGSRARAAGSLFIRNVALWLLALQLALWSRARRWFGATPVALGFFAQRGAVGFRGNARGATLRRRANSLTLGALVLLAHVLRAAN